MLNPFSIPRLKNLLPAWSLALALTASAVPSVEQWGVFEVALNGPTNGNPFLDVPLAARFMQGAVTNTVNGFPPATVVHVNQ